ncbi:MAG: DUF5107 domain-containing protein [Clostridia bacterium]|nr:DUF5107 domain-containing protein [Clostridia bacterium]
MSTVSLIKKRFSLAALGPEDPLPDMNNVDYVHSTVVWDDSLTQEDTRYMRYGRVSSILPYLDQDGYTRDRENVMKDTVVLENPFVRAEFLPWMGGRMRSLICRGREMLHVNPVIQPCNLALRNAWCSGGVEWNVSIRGHNMLTNEPLFTELLRLEDGTAGVRFYEYERIRGIVYRLEAYLPPMSRFLFVQARIENPAGNGERPMYWWSNIAVPETKGTRVIAPADTAILSLYDAGRYRMLRTALPGYEGMDLSRPSGIKRSLDVFFDVRPNKMPFITALKEDHTGLVQCSTGFMLGRKLFVWGMGQGGRHWQEFLSDGSETYIEIQAGIAKTQQDHLPMPENTAWTWLEAYGSLTSDVDGLSYTAAAEKCQSALYEMMTRETLEKEQAGRGRAVAAARGQIVLPGSGWGALENLRRAQAGLPPVSDTCRFPESSLGEKQAPWLALLKTGAFPEADPEKAPESYMTGENWLGMLEKAPANWAQAYQLAVTYHAAGDPAGAERSLKKSLVLRESAWAFRASARLDLAAGKDSWRDKYRRALSLRPDCRALLKEYAEALLKAGLCRELIAFLDGLPDETKALPRFQFLRAAGCVGTGDFSEAERILLKPLVLPDIREGELSLSEIWSRLWEKKEGLTREEAAEKHPLPPVLDFRMH